MRFPTFPFLSTGAFFFRSFVGSAGRIASLESAHRLQVGKSPARTLISTPEAVRVFGPGNVYGVFVMGLEPADSLFEGMDALSSLGAHVVPFVWSPNPGSRLYGHRAPRGAWYAENVRRFAEIIASKKLPPSINHCRKCDGNNMLHDVLDRRSIE